MYALIEDNKITRTTENLKAEFPHTSFPKPLPEEHEGWVKVEFPEHEIPAEQEILEQQVVLIEGVPTMTYTYALKKYTKDVFTSEIKQYRDEYITSEVSFNGVYAINNEETKKKVNEILTFYGLIGMPTTPIDWKGPRGYQSAVKSTFEGLYIQGGLREQRGFTAEKKTLDRHEDSPFKTLAEAKEYFNDKIKELEG